MTQSFHVKLSMDIHADQMFVLLHHRVFHHYEKQVQVFITYTRQTAVQLNRLLEIGKTIP